MFTKKTLPEIFQEKAAERLAENAFYYCRPQDNKWVNMTWESYRDKVTLLASWFLEQGVVKGDKIGLFSANRPEWIIADLAILSVGAITIPIYPTAALSDTRYILEHSEAKILVTDKLERISFLKQSRLHAIVSFNDATVREKDDFSSPVVTLNTLFQVTKPTSNVPIALDGDDIATIIYTSGTTGRPKGVIHSHGNLFAAIDATYEILATPAGQTDRYFSFLPLSHVAERQLVEVGSIITGSEVAFARSIETLAEDLIRCRPTILLCVPRLWEKIYEKIQGGLSLASPLKRGLFYIAKLMGEQRIRNSHILAAQNQSLSSKIAEGLVGKKMRTKLGLDQCRMLLTGAAPTRPDVMRFFAAFGMMIQEVYGLTENLCLGTYNDAEVAVIGSCGKPFPGNEMKIAGDGEILFRAPWMFKGYYRNEEATREVMDAEGWFYTGDLGNLDSEGRLRIVGRKKELLKTSGGKYIAPVPIEDSLKAHPLVKDAIVIGDQKNYCIALVSLEEERLEKIGKDSSHDELIKLIQSVNETLANYESIKRVGIMSESFSVENGTLTPTLKVKRSVVTLQNETFINRLYSVQETVVCQG